MKKVCITLTSTTSAPECLLQVIRCNCQTDCNTLRCSCKKYHIECNFDFSNYKGTSRSNTSHDIDADTLNYTIAIFSLVLSVCYLNAWSYNVMILVPTDLFLQGLFNKLLYIIIRIIIYK